MASRVISSDDLVTAGFDGVADTWGTERGIIQNPETITASSITISNDPSKFYLMNSASPQTIILPSGLDDLGENAVITIVRLGDGTVTIEPDDDVVEIVTALDGLTMNTKNTVAQLIRIDEEKYLAVGSLS